MAIFRASRNDENESGNNITDVSIMDGVKEILIISMSVVWESLMNTDQTQLISLLGVQKLQSCIA
jgi:hypothetical protein